MAISSLPVGWGGSQQQLGSVGGSSGSSGVGNSGSDLGSLLSGFLGAGANMYANQNAAEAENKGILAGIGTQQGTMGQINSIYSGQSALGNGAFSTLGSTLGLNGQPANYSNFLNMPGYQFAVDQGTQAINRGAAAQGSAFTPNTLIDVGKYVTGTAMQDYNTYVQQLMGAAGFGQQANQAQAQAQLQTNENISQLQQNSGVAEAGGQTAQGGTLSRFLGGPNGSGLINGIANGIGSLFGGGSGGSSSGGGLSGLIGKGIGAIGSIFKGSGSNGSNTNTGAGSSDGLGFIQGGGPNGTDYSPYVSSPDYNPYQNNSPYGSIPSDSAGNPDWLSTPTTPDNYVQQWTGDNSNVNWDFSNPQ